MGMGVEERSDQQQCLVEHASSHSTLETIGLGYQARDYVGKGHVNESIYS